MVPGLALEGGVGLALLRGASVAALLSVFGALAGWVAMSPVVAGQAEAGVFARRWGMLFWGSWVVCLGTTVGWLVVQAGVMADADGMAGAFAALPGVLTATWFGHVVAARLGLVALAGVALRFRSVWLATGLAGVAMVTQAGLGHASAMYDGPSWLLTSEVVHLVAAGVWLGGLTPLLLVIGLGSPGMAAAASRRFSPLGAACVVLLAMTAGFQSWVLVGGLAGLVGTGYGRVALVKAGLFGVLLALAAGNRFRLTPALGGVDAAAARRRLYGSVAAETGVGLLVVLAAGVLTSLPPGMHLQPVWPFAERLSLDSVREDAGFRLEVIEAGLGVAAAVALLLLAVLARRWRWRALAGAAVLGWWAAPHLDLLFVEAYPTSFYTSPTGFAAAGIVAGAGLYAQHCAVCHGAEGRGDGPGAAGLAVPPADLTASHLWMHSDGELFWWVSHGIADPGGAPGLVMPGFATVLPEEGRWAVIDYIRAHNAGVVRRESGEWSPPVQAPGLQADCGGRQVDLTELRGRVVRVVIGDPAPVVAGVVTIVAGVDGEAGVGGDCVADDGRTAQAYGIVSGIAEGALRGTQFLIDGQGWLRALQRPDADASWNEEKNLVGVLREIAAHPIAGADAPMDMRM